MRAERERIAKEKADIAEQRRLDAERAAAAEQAASEESSDSLFRALFVGTVTAAIGAGAKLDTGKTLQLAGSAALDGYRGDANMSTLKSTAQALSPSAGKSGSGNATSNTAAQAARITPKENKLKTAEPRLAQYFRNWESKKDSDVQFWSECATAQTYYDEYVRACNDGRQTDANRIYVVHAQAAEIAMQMAESIDAQKKK